MDWVYQTFLSAGISPSTRLYLSLAAVILASLWFRRGNVAYGAATKGFNLPPIVPYSIPFLGSAIQYGMDPVVFLKDCRAKVNTK